MTTDPSPRYFVQRGAGNHGWRIFDAARLLTMGHYADRDQACAAALLANRRLEQAEEDIRRRLDVDRAVSALTLYPT